MLSAEIKKQLILETAYILFLSFLDEAFETLGGVPEEIVTDNTKTVMEEARTEYFAGKVNIRFQQFADDYGFCIRPCIAGRPQTKAKVEAPMKILDEIRAYNGKLDYCELNELVKRINNRVNSEVNQGNGRIPLLYFAKEKASLCSLPADTIRKLYQISSHTVKVDNSSMFHYRGNRYSVPPEYVGKQVTFQLIDKRYEKKSTISITNMNFNEWNEIFYDAVISNAILDRLLHHFHIITIFGKSYRLRNRMQPKD